MNAHEQIILINNYEKLRTSFVKAVNDAKGDGEALWQSLDSFTTQDLMIHLAPNHIKFVYDPPDQ